MNQFLIQFMYQELFQSFCGARSLFTARLRLQQATHEKSLIGRKNINFQLCVFLFILLLLWGQNASHCPVSVCCF